MTPERVAAASDAWVYVPENATVVETDGYLLVRLPDWFEHPSALLRWRPTLEPAAVLDGLLAAGGGLRDEVLEVLALDLEPGPPDLSPPDGLALRWTTEPDVVRDAEEVSVRVFGGAVPPDDELAVMLERDRATIARGEGGIVVAYEGGRPLGFGGVSVVDGVARLWGGAVLDEARRRGVYRAVLAERIRYALAHGATMALVKSRVSTAGPILRRAGFAPYGQEWSYVVPL